jgi:outer membrane protein OmpA-like peptidoglycan-associated protein
MRKLPALGLALMVLPPSLLGQAESAVLNAASLVKDGGFEQRRFCPSDFNQQRLRTLDHWGQVSDGTPDHFASCSKEAGVPGNRFGTEPSLEGDAYGGLVVFSRAKWRYREYLSTELTRSLTPGEWVCVSFWYSAAESAGVVADGFGALLSSEKPVGERDYALGQTPQVVNPRGHFLESTEGWTRLSDVVQAKGGERWLTLGNFDPKGQTRLALSAQAPKDATDWAYIYLDGVEVVPVSKPEDCACLIRKIAREMQDPPEPLTRVVELERDTLHFGFDDDALQPEDRAKLDRWGAMLRRNRFLRLEVHGHTDAVGPEGYNADLSARRAQAAFAYLMDQGVAPDRMRTDAHGSARPAASNANAGGRARNRRVEFRLVEQAFIEVD